MKLALTGLLCALIFNSLSIAQEQPTPNPSAAQRKPPAARPERPVAGRQITLDVLIADLAESLDNPTVTKILELEKTGKLAAATRLRMLTLDENPGFIQIGGRSGARTAFSGSRGGPGGTPPATTAGFTSSPASPNTNLQFQATTRIEDDGSIIIQFYFERPEAAVPQKLVGSDATGETRRDFAFLSQSTVRLKSSDPKLISGRQSTAGAAPSQTWIVLTASPEGEPAGGNAKP
jgi:hypothetical protein